MRTGRFVRGTPAGLVVLLTGSPGASDGARGGVWALFSALAGGARVVGGRACCLAGWRAAAFWEPRGSSPCCPAGWNGTTWRRYASGSRRSVPEARGRSLAAASPRLLSPNRPVALVQVARTVRYVRAFLGFGGEGFVQCSICRWPSLWPGPRVRRSDGAISRAGRRLGSLFCMSAHVVIPAVRRGGGSRTFLSRATLCC